MPFFGKTKYTLVKVRKKDIPDGLWTKCPDCNQPIYNKALSENLWVCPKCSYHFTINAKKRIQLIVDRGSFKEIEKDMHACDPLNFKGPKSYKEKLQEDKKATGLNDAVIVGEAEINGKRAMLAVTDSNFIMGSMGSVVGEKITKATEIATEKGLSVITISGSGGGARMYEGMFSLMQMARTCAALGRHHKAKLPHISILTNPTMAGIMASFAGLGDVAIAEPKALIGFTGPRVIEQTIRQKLPEGFQKSEFLLEHGLIDIIVNRKDLKSVISSLIDYFS